MADLIEYIQSQVYENSTEDISGSIMQQVLTRMASDEGVVNVHTISGQTPFADYNNAQAARDAVPAGFKKLGLIITYKLSSGWYIDEFIGSATSGWSTASNWKCLGPISVSQNASTGKTTITIGSQSYDVATQPVSVSQNLDTNHADVKIGNAITPVTSIKELTDFKAQTLLNVPFNLLLNEFRNVSHGRSDTAIGWITTDILSIDKVDLVSINSENTIGYKIWSVLCYADDGSFIGNIDLGNGGTYYSFKISSIFSNYPLTRNIALNIWDGSTITELTPSDAVDIDAKLESYDNLSKQVVLLNERDITTSSDCVVAMSRMWDLHQEYFNALKQVLVLSDAPIPSTVMMGLTYIRVDSVSQYLFWRITKNPNDWQASDVNLWSSKVEYNETSYLFYLKYVYEGITIRVYCIFDKKFIDESNYSGDNWVANKPLYLFNPEKFNVIDTPYKNQLALYNNPVQLIKEVPFAIPIKSAGDFAILDGYIYDGLLPGHEIKLESDTELHLFAVKAGTKLCLEVKQPSDISYAACAFYKFNGKVNDDKYIPSLYTYIDGALRLSDALNKTYYEFTVPAGADVFAISWGKDKPIKFRLTLGDLLSYVRDVEEIKYDLEKFPVNLIGKINQNITTTEMFNGNNFTPVSVGGSNPAAGIIDDTESPFKDIIGKVYRISNLKGEDYSTSNSIYIYDQNQYRVDKYCQASFWVKQSGGGNLGLVLFGAYFYIGDDFDHYTYITNIWPKLNINSEVGTIAEFTAQLGPSISINCVCKFTDKVGDWAKVLITYEINNSTQDKVGVRLITVASMTYASPIEWTNIDIVNTQFVIDEKLPSISESVLSDGFFLEAWPKNLSNTLNEVSEKVAQLDNDVYGEQVISNDLLIVNKLVYPNGSMGDANGWVCINKLIPITANHKYKLQNEDGYGIWVLRCYNSSKELIDSYQVTSVGEAMVTEFTYEEVNRNVPLTAYIKVDFWDGSSTDALAESFVLSWRFIAENEESIIKKVEDLDTRVTNLEEGRTEALHTCHLNFAPNEESWVESPFYQNYKLRAGFKINRNVYGSTHETMDNPCLNFTNVSLVNGDVVTTFANTPDDIAPENINGTYIGANHGCSDFRLVTMSSAHGKTAADIGSQWMLGDIQVTLMGIPSATKLMVLPSTNTYEYPKWHFANISQASGTFTHVSGATHTEDFTGTIEMEQYKPAMIKNISRVLLDGKEVSANGDYVFNNEMVIQEQYDVLNIASMLEYVKAHVGTFTHDMLTEEDLAPVDRVTSHNCSYIFKNSYQWVWAIDFTAYQDLNISYYGYIQQPYLPGSNCKLYIPRTLPITWVNPSTQEQVVTDFRTPQDHSSRPVTLNITTQYWEDADYAPDRYLEFTDSAANYSGFLPDNEIGGANRKNFINNAFFLYTSRKVYPHGIDDKLTVHAGDTFSGAVFRNYIHPSQLNQNGVLSQTFVEYKGNVYMYVDFTTAGKYEIKLPSNCAGKSVVVIDKSSNIQVLSKQGTGALLVKVSSVNPWSGSLICKFSE